MVSLPLGRPFASLTRRGYVRVGDALILNDRLDYPSIGTLQVRLAAARLDVCVAGLEGARIVLSPEQMDRALEQSPPNVRLPQDDLGCLIRMSGEGEEKRLERSRTELAAFRQLYPLADHDLTGFQEFRRLLVDIHRRGVGDGSAFRCAGMRTSPDQQGFTVEFPRPGLIENLLLDLLACLTEPELSPAMKAVAAYVGFIHCHPFSDGNGRTARLLFNLMLSRACDRPVFIPWSWLCHRTGHAMLIKTRRALYGNDWSPLVDFTAAALRFAEAAEVAGCPFPREDPSTTKENGSASQSDRL